jgi:hypothetical protein
MGALGRMKKKVERNNAPPPGGAIGTATDMADPNKQGGIDPAKKKQVEDTTAMFMELIHGKDTRDSVLKMLKSQPDPFKAIPLTANNLMVRVEAQTKKRKLRIPEDVKIAAAQYIVMDLANLGNKANLWETKVQQDNIGPILRDTMQAYIHKGIRDKTIDPVQLQEEAEKLMSPEQKAISMQMGGGQLPPKPTATMAARQHTQGAVDKEKDKNMQLQAQTKAVQGAPQQALPGQAE